MNIALYPRVSTQEQAEHGYSIDEQIERMQKYCDAMGWTVYKIYTDAGFSGGNTNRPGLQRMIKDVKAGNIDKVLVYKLDRLSRSQLDTLYLIEKVFLENKVDFVSMSENFDTSTPFGRAMIGILAVFAQLEREQIKERMVMGREARAKCGKFHGGSIDPIGYDYVNGELIINEFESIQIKKIFELAKNNNSVYQIQKYMNEHGYTHKSGKWGDRTIRRCLRNELYIGCIKHRNELYRGTHTPLIDKQTFYDVQNILEQRYQQHKEYNRRIGKANTYLGGFLYCAQCGAKYSKHNRRKKYNGKTYEYQKYVCNSRLKRFDYLIKDPYCNNKNWNVDELTDLVFNQIKQLAIDPAFFDQIKEDRPQDNTPKILKNEIEKIDGQISRLMDLYTIGQMPIDVIQNKIHELNDKKTTIEAELENVLMTAKNALTRSETITVVNTFDDVLERGDFDEIRTVISILIEKIVIDNDEITIHWNF